MKKTFRTLALFSVFFAGCEEFLLGPEPENSPKGNFEILWQTLDENYALFSVKNVNWDSLHVVYGSKVTEATTDSQLWDIATGMLSHLDDGHVMIFNKDFSKIFNSSSLNNRPEDDFSLNVVKTTYLDTSFTAGAGFLTYGKIKNSNIGYVHIASFNRANAANVTDWTYDIDKVVRELYECDGMIVDVRNNGGGFRNNGHIICSAFIDRERTYFYQRLKNGPGHNDFSQQRAVTIAPRPGTQRYTKKNAVLTNRFTASVSEYAVQIFRTLPYSTQIGDTTFGMLGDVTSVAHLPNGWIFWYPCTFTTTPEGYCPEGIGIIPDILVENTRADINRKRDNVLERAIQYLLQ